MKTKSKKNSNSKKFYVTCTCGYDGDINRYRVSYKGKKSFATFEEAKTALEHDMKEYAESEKAAGFETKIVSFHLEWKDQYVDREARWGIHEA